MQGMLKNMPVVAMGSLSNLAKRLGVWVSLIAGGYTINLVLSNFNILSSDVADAKLETIKDEITIEAIRDDVQRLSGQVYRYNAMLVKVQAQLLITQERYTNMQNCRVK